MIRLFIFFKFSLFSCLSTADAQTYKINSRTVWFTEGNVRYTEGDFEKIRRFAEYLLDQKLSPLERQEAKKEAEISFRNNPNGTLQEIREIDGQMAQVYLLTDVKTVASVRSAILSHVYPILQQETNKSLMAKLIDRYCPVIAYDTNENYAITRKDIHGMIQLLLFINQVNGNNTQVTASEKEKAANQLIKNIKTMSTDEKRLLANMGIYNDYIQTVYAKASFSEKKQIREQLNASFAGTGYPAVNNHTSADVSRWDTMSASSYKLLSDMMMSSHVTNMNILEAAAGSNNYWTIKSY